MYCRGRIHNGDFNFTLSDIEIMLHCYYNYFAFRKYNKIRQLS